MNISFDLLRSFLTVHRAGSITAAAELLGLAQPTVTAQLRSLEATLGTPLFDRLPRGVRPTAAGNELAGRIAEPIDALEKVLLEDGPGAYPTTVRLGGPAELLCELALPALAPLVADGLQLRTEFGLPDDLADGVLAGRLDLAVLSVRPRRRGLVVHPLCDEEFALVAARPLTVGNPEELQDLPLVAYSEEGPILRRYWRTVFGTRLTRTPDLVAGDLRGVLNAVLAGAGASVLPRYLCAPHLAAGRLHALAEPELPPINTLYLVHRPPATGQRAVAAVRAELVRAAHAW